MNTSKREILTFHGRTVSSLNMQEKAKVLTALFTGRMHYLKVTIDPIVGIDASDSKVCVTKTN
jgi:hypothetical protein